MGNLIRESIHILENGLLEYGAGLGEVEGETCLILCVEVDASGARWAHVFRLIRSERVLASQVVHYKEAPDASFN